MLRRYEHREENLAVLRGRLGIAEQVRLNAANPERLYCRFDEFQEDNPLNQVLKAGLKFLLNVSRQFDNQRQLAEMLLTFDSVSDLPRQSLPWKQVVFDRLTERYRPCVKLAELFLAGNPPDVTGGNSQAFSLFFDMNMLFEEYIGRMARRVFMPLGYQVVLQGPQRFLALDVDRHATVFAMRPDITASRGGRVAWIIDTKWKSLDLQKAREGVVQSDLYQMHAYANCYDCADVVLLYPHHSELGGVPGARGHFKFNSSDCTAGGSGKQVRIGLSDLGTVEAQLKAILRVVEY
jgi:5-methylcytosine-specific restriction enzyme subunit McrC